MFRSERIFPARALGSLGLGVAGPPSRALAPEGGPSLPLRPPQPREDGWSPAGGPPGGVLWTLDGVPPPQYAALAGARGVRRWVWVP